MGERDLSSAVSSRTAAAGGRLLAPLAILVFLTLIAVARPLQPPDSARGVSHCLAAASLGRDLDLRFEDQDLERFRGFVQTESLSVLLARSDGSGAAAFPATALGSLYVAPFVRLGSLRGVLFAHALALALALSLAASTLRQRFDSVWRVLLVCLFGSVALPFLLEPRPESLTLAAVVAAFALAFRGETPRFEELADVFDDRAERGRFAVRWIGVGALLGFAALSHPVHLLLFLPAVVAIPPAARRSAGVLLAVGAAITVGVSTAVAFVAGGVVFPWGSELALFTPATGFPGVNGDWSGGSAVPSVLAAARPVIDLSLLGWNVLFVAVGRNIGALPYFLPVILLLALWEPGARRSTLVATAGLAALLSVVIWPYDYAGDGVGLGNALLLPIFGALWLVPTRRTPLWAPLAILVAAGFLLWPTWLQSIGLWTGGSGPGSTVTSVASRWLPHESTRRPQGTDYVAQGGLRALPAGGGVSTRRGRLFLIGGRWGNVALAAPQPLSRIYLAFDGQAGSELEVAGGELGHTLFRGDGGVGFEVTLQGKARRHPMWFSSEPQSLYDVRLRLPNAPRVPVAFGVEGDTEP